MKVFISTLFSISMTVGVSIAACAQTPDSDPIDFGPKEALSIVSDNGQHDFMVEVADTPEEQRRGLMFRENLPENEGMLFEFDTNRIQTIWMKNTPIPLDILFVRGNGKILKIQHSAQPYTLRTASSEAPVPAVVELPGGRANDLGIEPGDQVLHPYFKTVTSEAE